MMKKSEADVIRAALAWFESRRPNFWQESDHLAQPTIKRIGVRQDEALAQAVADYRLAILKRQKKRGTKNGL